MRMYKYLLFILPLLLSCCMREDAEPVVPGGDDLDVKFVLQKNASSRAMDADAEDYIGRIDVLAFKVNGSAETFAYHAKAKTIDNANRQFTVTLRRGGSDSYRFVIVANLEDSQGDALSHIAATGVKEEVLKKWLTIRNTGKWNATGPGDFRPIPMWGETGVMQITESTASSGISGITIVRMLSRIDVELTEAARNNFKLVQVDLYNRKTRGYVAPLKVNWDEATHTATAVSVPEDNDPADPLTLFDPLEYKTATTAGVAFEKAIYIFEAAGVTGSDKMEATSIVVGGYYDPDNNTTEMSYYRIDIKPESAALLARDLKRNHNYHVGISVVGKKGAGSSIDAFYGDFTLETEITAWNNAGQNIILDGQYFLRLSQSKISLWSTGNTVHITAETNYDGKYNNAGNPGVRLNEAWGNPGWRTVSISAPTLVGGVYTYDISVEVQDYINGVPDGRWNAFWIEAGNMQCRMDVWQGHLPWFTTNIAADYEPGNTRYEITTTTSGNEKWRITGVSDPDGILFSKDQYVGMTGTNNDKLPFYIKQDALPGKAAQITFENMGGDNPPVTIEIKTKP